MKTIEFFRTNAQGKIDETLFSPEWSSIARGQKNDELSQIVIDFWEVGQKEGENLYHAYKETLAKLQPFNKNFYSAIIESILFYRQKNFGAMRERLQVAGKTYALLNSFDFNRCGLTNQRKEEFLKAVTRLLRVAPIKEMKPEYYSFFMHQVEQVEFFQGKELFPFPAEKLLTPLEYKDLSSKSLFLMNYPATLARIVSTYFDGADVKNVVDKAVAFNQIRPIDSVDLEVYYYHYPTLAENDEKKLAEIFTKGSLVERYILLRDLEDPALKKALEKYSKQVERPLFQLKRSFYRELLMNHRAGPLAVYHLIELGEYDLDYLWWLRCE